MVLWLRDNDVSMQIVRSLWLKPEICFRTPRISRAAQRKPQAF